jgi:hypothetical protein
MSITFRCEHCHKEVKAEDSTVGKRGKCPFCSQDTYIPSPVSEDEILPLAPVDEQEEQRQRDKVKALLAAEHELLSESGQPISIPLEHREDISVRDLHHFVVNYCLDMFGGHLERSEINTAQLKSFGALGRQAVDDFLERRELEPALDHIPGRVLQGFLMQLKQKLTS